MILKLGIQLRGKFHKVYINYATGLTLAYFVARPNLVAYAFGWETVTKSFNGNICDCLPLPKGYKHVFLNIFSETVQPIKAKFYMKPPL